MNLSIHKLMPAPLLDRLAAYSSEVWDKEHSWAEGTRLFVQAPSGTGKTTLIHILYGLRTDFEGKAYWNKAEIGKQGAEVLSAMRQREVSIIFQDMRIFPSLTAWENLEIKRVLTSTTPQEGVRAMMEALGIADRAGHPAYTLSYGEQQRVAIIRSLLQPFRWLLMDEPFSHLDEANTARAASLIDEVVRRNGASFLLADLDDNAHFSYTQKLKL